MSAEPSVFVVGAVHVMVALDVAGAGSGAGAGAGVETGGGLAPIAEVGEESGVAAELDVARVAAPAIFAGSGFAARPVDATASDAPGEPAAPHPVSDRIAASAISAAVEEDPLK